MAFTVYFFAIILLPLLAIAQLRENLPENVKASKGFGVSPTKISLKAKPGIRTTTKFSIKNYGIDKYKSVKYLIEVADVGQNEAGYPCTVMRGYGTRSCADWLNVPKEVEIKGGSTEQIKVQMYCPPGASGAYYANLKVSMAPEQVGAQMYVSVRPVIGVSIELTFPGPSTVYVEPKDIIYKSGSSPSLVFNIKNAGVWKVPIEGDVLLYKESGGFPIRTSIPYRSEGIPYEVYPGMSIKLNCPLPEALRPERYKILCRLRVFDKPIARKEFVLEVTKRHKNTTISAKEGSKMEMNVNLSVKPELFEVVLPAGGMRTLPIRVRNSDTCDVQITAQIAQARMEPSGMLTYQEIEKQDDFSWVSVSPDFYILNPKRSAAFRITAALPKTNSIPLPVAMVVLLKAEAIGTKKYDNWSYGGEFSVLVVFQAPRTPSATLEKIKFDVVRASPNKNPSVAILRLKNTGGKMGRITGRIILERITGQEILHMKVGSPDQPNLIFPGNEREYCLQLGPLDIGDFRVRADLITIGKKRQRISDEVTFEVVDLVTRTSK